MMLDAASVTINVSGYPAVAAMMTDNGATRLAVAELTDLERYGDRLTRVLHGRSPYERSRCHGCNLWVPRSLLQDRRLGFDQYCDACVSEGVRRCLAREGRLPGPGEFWCFGCQWIVAEDWQAMDDPDGRQRFRCRGCRGDQVRAAEARRRSRIEAVPVGTLRC